MTCRDGVYGHKWDGMGMIRVNLKQVVGPLSKEDKVRNDAPTQHCCLQHAPAIIAAYVP